VGLLARGEARACRDGADVLALLTGEPRRPRRTRARGHTLSLAAGAVLGAIAARGAHPDEIARETGLGAAEVQTILTELSLLGLVAPDGFGCFRRVG
jgi:predicted Rossmann fold nucleotide-binding protein DprA/Smf involved in DNA uptake